MDRIVYEVLRIDKEVRSDLTKDIPTCKDLIELSQIKPQEWDYSLPTLARETNIRTDVNLPQFIQTFYKLIPFKIDMRNIIIAGGMVSSILLGSKSVHDVDIFIYGLDPQQATARVDEISETLCGAYLHYLIKEQESKPGKKFRKEEDDGPPPAPTYSYKCIRNQNCVTITFDDKFIFQIILRVYRSIDEILHGFDIGSSAVGFDGERLYFTSLSQFAYSYGCNIVDTSHRSTTYEYRLTKYYGRGFEIIVPHMNVSRMRNINSKYNLDDVCEMPHFAFSYSNICGNKIIVHRFLSTPQESAPSDYQTGNVSEASMIYVNLRRIVQLLRVEPPVQAQTDFYFYSNKKGNISTMVPFLSRRKVINFYDALAKRAHTHEGLNIRLLRTYVANASAVLREILEKGDTDQQFADLLFTRIQEEKSRVLALVDQILARNYPLQWVTKNPGTQITASFNPIIEDEKLWYGPEYFIAEHLSMQRAAEAPTQPIYTPPSEKAPSHSAEDSEDVD